MAGRSKFITRTTLAAALICAASVSSARAATITIDSTNCNSSSGCYGLEWMLTVNTLAAPTTFGGVSYDYQAILQVLDDPNVAGDPTAVISAVDFKASSGVSSAALYTYPSLISGGWTTSVKGLNSGGCGGSSQAGFVCSQSSTDPANFTAPINLADAITWGWYFNTSDPIFTSLIGAHIGAKMTDLSNNGKLLSASYTVPEPGTLTLLAAGFAALVATRGRRRRAGSLS